MLAGCCGGATCSSKYFAYCIIFGLPELVLPVLHICTSSVCWRYGGTSLVPTIIYISYHHLKASSGYSIERFWKDMLRTHRSYTLLSQSVRPSPSTSTGTFIDIFSDINHNPLPICNQMALSIPLRYRQNSISQCSRSIHHALRNLLPHPRPSPRIRLRSSGSWPFPIRLQTRITGNFQ